MAGFIYQRSPFCLIGSYLPTAGKEDLPCEVHSLPIEDAPPKEARDLAKGLEASFEGKPFSASMDSLDLDGLTDRQVAVLRAVAAIPHGEVCSYGEIARRAGCPRASRFVGSVMASNRFPMIIPCHRVIRSDGSLGGFGGRVGLKEKMLALESGN